MTTEPRETRRGSGKQVMLRILAALSTQAVPEGALAAATKRLRAGLLLHGSTSDDSYANARRLAWVADRDAEGAVGRQGIGTATGGVLLSDVFETMIEAPGLKEYVLARHAALTDEDYAALEWAMWLLVSSVQMFPDLLQVETVDVDRWIENYAAKFEEHFRDR